MIGTKIRNARISMGLTQKDLGNLLGLTNHKVITSWEKGKTKPDSDKIAMLCKVFNCPLEYFFPDPSLTGEGQNGFSDEEIRLLLKYRELDDVGKAIIINELEVQKRRVLSKEITIDGFQFETDPLLSEETLFLDIEHNDYEEMKLQAKEISKLKKKSLYSYETIIAFLAVKGYYGLVSIADLIAITHSIKVPSKKFYTDIKQILITGIQLVEQEKKN